ncbi:helix-turn-helix domain-containing protein [Nocardia salmonicida]|uniref:Helix-turn-helix domain-containing protein n=1 Tax=Nocardia salmonicida TaxID=53431 RepID=A0ABZ1N9B4_9NOCA
MRQRLLLPHRGVEAEVVSQLHTRQDAIGVRQQTNHRESPGPESHAGPPRSGHARPWPPARVTLAVHDIGEYLVAWRKLLGLTAEQVSERAGVARSTYRRLEQSELVVSAVGYQPERPASVG